MSVIRQLMGVHLDRIYFSTPCTWFSTYWFLPVWSCLRLMWWLLFFPVWFWFMPVWFWFNLSKWRLMWWIFLHVVPFGIIFFMAIGIYMRSRYEWIFTTRNWMSMWVCFAIIWIMGILSHITFSTGTICTCCIWTTSSTTWACTHP